MDCWIASPSADGGSSVDHVLLVVVVVVVVVIITIIIIINYSVTGGQGQNRLKT